VLIIAREDRGLRRGTVAKSPVGSPRHATRFTIGKRKPETRFGRAVAASTNKREK